MKNLLLALGHEPSYSKRVHLIGTVALTVSVFLTLKSLVQHFFQWPSLQVHLVCWAIWFAWQGVIFPKARKQRLVVNELTAYRNMFSKHILPGASCGVGQMLSPFVHGILTSSTLATSRAQVVTACSMTGLGLLLLVLAFRTIGFARAGFVDEYSASPRPFVISGIYAHIRHPLFLGGVIASAGSSLFFVIGEATFGLALVNLSILPIYKWIEDSRLSGVFGDAYTSYRLSVNGFIPKLTAFKVALKGGVRAGLHEVN